ncbi:MAG: GHKL domain-containing protein, partial [Bacteroidetes bacterium]|nr:GHKL domain-containing protein [Bacteroidota bacterium]
DITEQRRAQEQLQRRDRLTAMGELAGGIAHEIRNPLNAISIIAQRFYTEFEPKADIEEYRQLSSTIRSEVQRANRIITQFLEFARPPRLVLHDSDMTDILRESVDVIRSQARMKHVHVQLMVPESLPIRADREKMQQVFLNLLQNALDAVDDGGEIKCIACRSRDHVMVSIADNGAGIPEEQQAKIFNLYYTTKASGTGLGLSIVHQIISEHGGEISVTSHPDQGTTFRILFRPAPEIRHDD